MFAMVLTLLSSASANEMCPIVKFVGEGTSAVLYEDQTTLDLTWDGSVTFETTPYTPSGPETTPFTTDMVGYGNLGYAWAAGIDVDGNLVTWGYTITATTPSGEEPYSSPECGDTGKCVVLDNGGHVETFFNGATGTFNTGRPTAGNFDGVSAGRDVGCAWDADTATGVTCWGSNADNLVNNAAKPGNGIQIVGAAVGRYAAVAWDVDGDTYCWHTSRAGYSATADEFCANRPLNGVVDMDITESGAMYGVAHHANGEMTVWQYGDEFDGANDVLTAAPGWDTYGDSSYKQYQPEGPNGVLIWRSVGLNIYGTGVIYGVIEDGMGLDESGEYVFGDALTWNDDTSYANVSYTCYTE